MQAFQIYLEQTGGPEVLQWKAVDVPSPGPGQVLLKQTAIGLNFSDIYAREGKYPMPVPGGLGTEAAGVVEAVGEGVENLKIGDRVAYLFPVPGAYAEYRVMPAGPMIKLPDSIDDITAAAMVAKGLTASYLLHNVYPLQAGEWVLLQAAAGGVGSIIAQWAKAKGAHVIGVVGSEAKRAIALENGCEHVLLSSDDVAARVKEITEGRGVDVVYDGVGKEAFYASIDSLKPLGMMVNYGNASGIIEPFSPMELMSRGSLFFTKPSGKDYLANPAIGRPAGEKLMAAVLAGDIKIRVGQTFPLKEAAKAQQALESRQTLGSTVLIP